VRLENKERSDYVFHRTGNQSLRYRREAPQFRLGRRNPDAKDGKFTDSTMPRWVN